MPSSDTWAVASQEAVPEAFAGSENLARDTAPDEGSLIWFYLSAAPKVAPNAENDHKLINYLLEPQVIADITAVVGLANANSKLFAAGSGNSSDDLVDPHGSKCADCMQIHLVAEINNVRVPGPMGVAASLRLRPRTSTS